MISSITSLPISVIVPAAGIGQRMKADRPKQYLLLNGKSVLEHTVETLLSHPIIDFVIVAVSQEDPYFNQLSISENPRVIRVDGGQERADSVLSGLNYIKDRQLSEWVLIHDAARPCIRHSDITKLVEQVIPNNDVGGILASPVRDTMKQATNEQMIETTVDRRMLWHALTPQLFKTKILHSSLRKGLEEGLLITDEASALELMEYQPKLVHGYSDNIKITQPEDLMLAEFYLNRITEEN